MDVRLLRESTRPEHEATEAVMPLMAPDLSLDSYVQVLRALHPIVSTFEQWAAAFAPEELRELVKERRRTHLLEADLARLGAEGPGAAPTALNWSEVATGKQDPESGAAVSEAEFLGCFYVMEGSTLGGRYIARHVESALHLTPGVGDTYFRGHEEQTGSMWREVTARIGEVPEVQAEVLIAAARRTFGAFGQALEAGLVPRQVHG